MENRLRLQFVIFRAEVILAGPPERGGRGELSPHPCGLPLGNGPREKFDCRWLCLDMSLLVWRMLKEHVMIYVVPWLVQYKRSKDQRRIELNLLGYKLWCLLCCWFVASSLLFSLGLARLFSFLLLFFPQVGFVTGRPPGALTYIYIYRV